MWQIWVSMAISFILFIFGLLKALDIVFWMGNLAVLLLLLWYVLSRKREDQTE